MGRTVTFEFTQSDGRRQTKSIEADTILIGSGPSAVLRIEHPEVSTLHAVLKTDAAGRTTLVDLGSDRGTTVNGAPVAEGATLSDGDRVGLGSVELIVRFGPRPEVEAPTERPTAQNSPNESPAPALKAKATERREEVDQVIQERENPIRPSDDLDTTFLASPLAKAEQPTDQDHALRVSAYWGTTLIDSALIHEPRDVTVGGTRGGPKHDLMIEADLPVENFVIATHRGTQASIVLPSDAKVGLRTRDGQVTRDVSLSGTDASFPAKAYNLTMGERLAFKTGTITFTAEYVRGEAEMGKGGAADWYFPRVLIISALLHVFFVIAAFVTPKVSLSLTDELFKNQNRFAEMILKAPEEDKKRKKLDLSGAKGAKHKDEEGKFGKKEKPPKDALASKAGAPRVDPNKREKDRQIALNSGLLGILKGQAGSNAVSNVFGPGGLGSGINNAMGGLQGTAMGDAGGAGGLGSRGTGAGGGGTGLGIGGLGGGHGRGSGGKGNIDLGGRGKGTTRVVPGKTIIQGSLSREEIGRVIRAHLNRFKYCYEKQLNANPNLSGKISVYFTIAPNGAVAQASVRETSMNDRNVEECVLTVMRSLKFPQPRGGGVVVVTYPFVFNSA